ncbi:Uncharacterised protein [Segatella copri]|nr:Uncharacterised protein [Segatella copri]
MEENRMSENDEKYTIFHHLSFINSKKCCTYTEKLYLCN